MKIEIEVKDNDELLKVFERVINELRLENSKKYINKDDSSFIKGMQIGYELAKQEKND